LGRKEGLSTNDCKEVKKDVQNAKVLRLKRMVDLEVFNVTNA